MWLGKVLGQVVSTAKEPSLSGLKLLLVQESPHEHPEQAAGSCYVAVDLVGAGNGEIVLVATGSAARVPDAAAGAPVDRAVVAIADSVISGGTVTYQK